MPSMDTQTKTQTLEGNFICVAPSGPGIAGAVELFCQQEGEKYSRDLVDEVLELLGKHAVRMGGRAGSIGRFKLTLTATPID